MPASTLTVNLALTDLLLRERYPEMGTALDRGIWDDPFYDRFLATWAAIEAEVEQMSRQEQAAIILQRGHPELQLRMIALLAEL